MTNEWIGANHSISITMKCYEHIELPDKNAIRESLERVFGNKLNMTENALQTPDRTMSNESQQLQGLSRGMDRTASKANSKAREFENGESPQPIAVAGFHGGERGIPIMSHKRAAYRLIICRPYTIDNRSVRGRLVRRIADKRRGQ